MTTQESENSYRSINFPEMKILDPSDVQRISEALIQHHKTVVDIILAQSREMQQDIEAMLERESDLTAHAIANAPYRLQELISEKLAVLGYDYDDLIAHSKTIFDSQSLDY